RARHLTDFLTQGAFAEQTCAVCMVVQYQKPAGACPVLLAYWPMAHDDAIKEAVLSALATVAIKDGKVETLLVDGLGAKEATKRALCALIVGRFGKEDQRSQVEKL